MISICFPILNGEKFIFQALSATIRQIEAEKIDAKILISNNLSDDKTEAICRKIQKNYNYIKIYNQKVRLRLSDNYNFLLNKVKTKYFMFHSHDDIRKENFYKKCIEILESNTKIVLCFTHAEYVDVATNKIYRNERCSKMGFGLSYANRFLNTIKNLETCAFHGIYRTSSVKKIGHYNQFLGSDHYFLNRLSCEGNFFEIKENLMTMYEPQSKWSDDSVENKIKLKKNERTFFFPFLRIFFLSIKFSLNYKNVFCSKIKIVLFSFFYFFLFLKNDINFITKVIKKSRN